MGFVPDVCSMGMMEVHTFAVCVSRWQSFVDSFFCYYILDVFIAIPYLSIWSFLVDRACHISVFRILWFLLAVKID